jgi:Ca2+-binding RTX toxin-like protein
MFTMLSTRLAVLLGMLAGWLVPAAAAAVTTRRAPAAGRDDLACAAVDGDTVNGGAGDDTVSGGPGDDTANGGAGDDTVNGGPGHDTIAGGAGNDTVRARDGQADRVDCGTGDDTAVLDPKDTISDATPQDPNGSCESVNRSNP